MWEIVTGSRLHFGLFQAGGTGEGQRRFGGVGMMIARPGLRVRATPAEQWSASGPLSDRVLSLLGESRGSRPLAFHVESAAPEHAGLGTGTQLSLAITKLLSVSEGRPEEPLADLVQRAGRGQRSGIGSHGFHQGGFLVDAGPRQAGALAPLVARVAVPRYWRMVLAIPAEVGAWHGQREQHAFDRLRATPPKPDVTDRLCRLTLLGMLPALLEEDAEAFGEALHEFNAGAGALFAEAQGGIYSGPRVATVIEFLRQRGIPGVGQSSWGPTVFAVVADEEQARFVARLLTADLGLAPREVLIAEPLNEGARVVDLDAPQR